PVDAATFTQAAGQELTVWYQLETRAGDTVSVQFFKPNGTHDATFDQSFLPGELRGGSFNFADALPAGLDLGTWHVVTLIHGVQAASDPFVVASTGAAAARVSAGGNAVANGRTTPVSFGSVPQNATPPGVTFTVTNLGSAALTLSNLSLPAGFSLVGS